MWKFYNSFEKMTQLQKSKELLRDELDNSAI